ncbi:MAG: hypothetical protein LBF25_01115 [Puniceicoccales bacterium]|jgi:hypothetical protein|nr:hypothetical protein [Puniceicoccales bacterium]
MKIETIGGILQKVKAKILLLCVFLCVGCGNVQNDITNRCGPDQINGIIAVKNNTASAIKVKFNSPGVNLDTPFFVGSISKQFCGVLALKHIPHLLNTDVTTLLSEEEFVALLRAMPECERQILVFGLS